MSKSMCPFPNEFDLMYRYHGWDGRRGAYVDEMRPAKAIKNNGWYTVYSNNPGQIHSWQRSVYLTSLRWYDLQGKIDSGILAVESPIAEDTSIDISQLL